MEKQLPKFDCPECGGKMQIDPYTHILTCGKCGIQMNVKKHPDHE
ncbi:MAG: hypothetical protein ABEK59_00270 [Halobacteria archaeon]